MRENYGRMDLFPSAWGGNPLSSHTPAATRPGDYEGEGAPVIILGVILIVIGVIASIPVLYSIGIALAVIGIILAVLGNAGKAIGGRAHWY
ncbi:hypothetical protein AB0N89_20975 [Amycolatopsis sp. NPDC089917]|uniref:hypothetical protein n=1 Tax=Amycolatopsis sp. NPDC089917 TaxID=3155187 RepID=UPI0034245167